MSFFTIEVFFFNCIVTNSKKPIQSNFKTNFIKIFKVILSRCKKRLRKVKASSMRFFTIISKVRSEGHLKTSEKEFALFYICHSPSLQNWKLYPFSTQSQERKFASILLPHKTLHKKRRFSLRISAVNMIKSAVYCGFGPIC